MTAVEKITIFNNKYNEFKEQIKREVLRIKQAENLIKEMEKKYGKEEIRHLNDAICLKAKLLTIQYFKERENIRKYKLAFNVDGITIKLGTGKKSDEPK